MRNHDAAVSAAKNHATKTVCRVAGKTADPMEMGQAIDELNKAWDELTDALVRQRSERDRLIVELLNELAERPKG